MTTIRDSYTSRPIGFRARYREVKYLWTFHRSEAENRVHALRNLAEQCTRTLKEAFGFETSGRRVLDVGPGQFLIQSRYFALRNDVVAIDTELIVERLTPAKFIEMVRCNGMQRAVKTLLRKALGVDRIYERALRKEFEIRELPRVDLKRGNASQMPFPNESFDMIYSRAVLHSIEEPAHALSEMTRVLKPGGVTHVDVHLYSSVNGSLDARVMHSGPNTDFHWAHIMPNAQVVEGAFLNRLRLSQWKELFAEKWPGSVLWTIQIEDPELRQEADRLLAHGKCEGYSIEDLLTTTVCVIWQKAPGREQN